MNNSVITASTYQSILGGEEGKEERDEDWLWETVGVGVTSY